jgi:hypothetical protein
MKMTVIEGGAPDFKRTTSPIVNGVA